MRSARVLEAVGCDAFVASDPFTVAWLTGFAADETWGPMASGAELANSVGMSACAGVATCANASTGDSGNNMHRRYIIDIRRIHARTIMAANSLRHR